MVKTFSPHPCTFTRAPNVLKPSRSWAMSLLPAPTMIAPLSPRARYWA
jgi:hypothetical protein